MMKSYRVYEKNPKVSLPVKIKSMLAESSYTEDNSYDCQLEYYEKGVNFQGCSYFMAQSIVEVIESMRRQMIYDQELMLNTYIVEKGGVWECEFLWYGDRWKNDIRKISFLIVEENH